MALAIDKQHAAGVVRMRSTSVYRLIENQRANHDKCKSGSWAGDKCEVAQTIEAYYVGGVSGLSAEMKSAARRDTVAALVRNYLWPKW